MLWLEAGGVRRGMSALRNYVGTKSCIYMDVQDSRIVAPGLYYHEDAE